MLINDTFHGLASRERLMVIVGGYGSGKTEVSVNLALAIAESGLDVSIADLDIVNPYFRCREARELMESAGVRVVVPPGDRAGADLPIVLPEIKGMLHPAEGRACIFDVGGDPVGARMLSSLHGHIDSSPHALWQVVNSRRPFTGTVEGCIRMRDDMEASSRLKVTGYIANTHLIGETSVDVIHEGYTLARDLSERTGVPLVFVSVMDEFADGFEAIEPGAPVFRMRRRMLPPWTRPTLECRGEKQLPAGRTVPLGRRYI
ncbi:MAG: cobalamin biosynthesis protein CbiA [Myxococcota bacterium]|jgi:hypothetical protein